MDVREGPAWANSEFSSHTLDTDHIWCNRHIDHVAAVTDILLDVLRLLISRAPPPTVGPSTQLDHQAK
eukprot:10067250-Prorocentrum_lima.AAC.1